MKRLSSKPGETHLLLTKRMPKRNNVKKSNGGAEIGELNQLHDKLVKACHTALENEVKSGDIKASTLNTIRQVCADAGVNPTVEASSAANHLLWQLPELDPTAIQNALRR